MDISLENIVTIPIKISRILFLVWLFAMLTRFLRYSKPLDTDGSEHCLRLPAGTSNSDQLECAYCIVGNRDRTLYAAVTSSVIYIFLSNVSFLLLPQLVLCSFKRSVADVEQRGEYRLLYWRHDSCAVCVTTSKNYLLIYRVNILFDKQCYNLIETRNENLRRNSQELFIKEKRPRVVLLRDEIFVCLANGWMHRLLWDGSVEEDLSFSLPEIPFAVDQLQSKPEHVHDRSVHVIDIVYTPLIGGFCIVLSNGKAALLTSPSPRFHPKQLLGVWASQVNDAICCSTNHKFRLVLIGCKSGDVNAFHLDDTNGSLVCTFCINLHIRDGPELLNGVGAVNHIECFFQGSAFAVVWSTNSTDSVKNGIIPPAAAIFSTFGAQLWCSLESSSDQELKSLRNYHWVDWGPEGFSLWFAGNSGFSVLPITRSICTSSPYSVNSEKIVLFSPNKIYVSPARNKEQSASAPHSVWRIFYLPDDYISVNWPLRMVAIDNEDGRYIAAAGSRGFAHCNTSTGKWRIFGNECQERDLITTGGLAIWNGFIMVACYDSDRAKEELRFYPVDQQLDNHFCTKHPTDSRILTFSIRGNKLITLDMDSRIFIYGLSMKMNSKSGKQCIMVERCAEIRISDLLPHPACIVSIHLASLSQDTAIAQFCDTVDTVLVNVCGRLIMLNPVKKDADTASSEEDDQFQLSQPMLIASYVEKLWHFHQEAVPKKPHLTQALWLNCGAKGLKVWMPLFINDANRGNIGAFDSSRSFISKRIMLPFELDIHPLVICGRDCLAVGLESIPSFTSELLLHNVLEEEATSAEPIPDPLLPRVVAFIREFPNFLQTVAHCARKTELALWHALFAVTSHPKELFEICIRDDQLETAASYLIVLQNMESSVASREHAALLLEEALVKRQWLIASDIVRFLRAIHPSDIDSPPRTPLCQRPHQNVSAATRRSALVSSKVTDETDPFVFGNYAAPANRKDSGASSIAKKVSKTTSMDSPPSPSDLAGSMHSYLQEILNRHASHLLEDYSVRDLGAFATYLNFDLIMWLSKNQSSAKVNDFGLALMRLHAQFNWPYPLVSQNVVDQLAKRIEKIKISQSCTSLLKAADSVLIPSYKWINTSSCETISNTGSDWEGLEKICGEVAARGSQESEIELKFMLDIMYETHCSDWTFLLCLLRRDFVFFNRYFNMEFLNKCGSDSLQRLHTGVEELKNWANNSWYASSPLLFCKFPINAINPIIAFSFGYRTIICAFDQRLRVLQKCGESESNPHLIRSISISSDAKTVKLMNQPF
ncbi:unnamed protein product [Dracunculus medinensis]|uniref:Protein RIC1 homolog n=1 Tax=Dracunculus medinensis TaxID=318479 RepID=A0A0N4UBK3_DRAME|nr:unnamed protein product [Dracunculus medinensis]